MADVPGSAKMHWGASGWITSGRPPTGVTRAGIRKPKTPGLSGQTLPETAMARSSYPLPGRPTKVGLAHTPKPPHVRSRPRSLIRFCRSFAIEPVPPNKSSTSGQHTLTCSIASIRVSRPMRRTWRRTVSRVGRSSGQPSRRLASDRVMETLNSSISMPPGTTRVRSSSTPYLETSSPRKDRDSAIGAARLYTPRSRANFSCDLRTVIPQHHFRLPTDHESERPKEVFCSHSPTVLCIGRSGRQQGLVSFDN